MVETISLSKPLSNTITRTQLSFLDLTKTKLQSLDNVLLYTETTASSVKEISPTKSQFIAWEVNVDARYRDVEGITRYTNGSVRENYHEIKDYVSGKTVYSYKEHGAPNAGKIAVELASDDIKYFPNDMTDENIKWELRNNKDTYTRAMWKNAGPKSPQGKQQFIEENQNKNPFWQFGIGIGDEVFDTIGVVGKVVKTVGRPITKFTGFSGIENSGRNLTQYTNSLSDGLDQRGFNRKGMAAGLGKGFTFIATSFIGVGLATKAVKATKLLPAIAAGATYIAKRPLIGMPVRSVVKNAAKFENRLNVKQNATRALATGLAVKTFSDVTTTDAFGNRDFRAIVSDLVLIPAGFNAINAARANLSKAIMQKMMVVKIASPEFKNLIAASLKETSRFTPFYNAKILLQIDKTLTNVDIIRINALQLRFFGDKNLRSPQDIVNAYRRYFDPQNIHKAVYLDNFLSNAAFRNQFLSVCKALDIKKYDLVTKSLSVPQDNINVDVINQLAVQYKLYRDQEIVLQNVYKTIVAVHGRGSEHLGLLRRYIVAAANSKYEVVANYSMDRYDPESPDKKLLKYIIADMKRVVGE